MKTPTLGRRIVGTLLLLIVLGLTTCDTLVTSMTGAPVAVTHHG